MNKHFATVIVAANCAIIISLLCLRGWLPPAPEKIEEVVEERRVEALRCKNCAHNNNLANSTERLDGKIDGNASHVARAITQVHRAPEGSNVIWLETKNLILRDARVTDVDDMHAYAHKAEVANKHTWAAHSSKLETMEFLKEWVERYKKSYITPWAIEEKSTGRMIGTAGVSQYYPGEPRDIISYTLSDSVWNKNYDIEVIQALIEFSVVALECIRVAALARCDDPVTQKALEDAGLSREGIEPEYKCVNDRYVSSYVYAFLTQEADPKIFANSVLAIK